jgi:hypothetical protein
MGTRAYIAFHFLQPSMTGDDFEAHTHFGLRKREDGGPAFVAEDIVGEYKWADKGGSKDTTADVMAKLIQSYDRGYRPCPYIPRDSAWMYTVRKDYDDSSVMVVVDENLEPGFGERWVNRFSGNLSDFASWAEGALPHD